MLFILTISQPETPGQALQSSSPFLFLPLPIYIFPPYNMQPYRTITSFDTRLLGLLFRRREIQIFHPRQHRNKPPLNRFEGFGTIVESRALTTCHGPIGRRWWGVEV